MEALDLAITFRIVPGGVSYPVSKEVGDILVEGRFECFGHVGVDGLGEAIAGEDFPFQGRDGGDGCSSVHGDGLDPFGEGAAAGEEPAGAGALAFLKWANEVDVELLEWIT